jgi:polyisoprenyl-teichoic acid--peptidoglycan teichoic acid transferase
MTLPLKMDLLGGEAEKRARRNTAWTAVGFAVAVGLFAAIGAGASYRAATHGTTVFEEVGNLPVIAEIRRLAWGSASDVPVDKDKMTFLFLGVGGEGHAGSNLTDTLLIATADLKEHRVGITSLPRDLAFPLGGGRFMKINAVHAYAEQSHPGEGSKETAKTIEDLLSIPIDHVVRVNFNGFKDFVDAIGGIEVNVERAFTDHEYPTEDDKWQTVSFEKGTQHMDGSRALIFVRSRHGSNGEAGDFARNHRQQLVMLALREKLLSKGTLANPQKLLKLYETVARNVQTDLSPWDLVRLAPLASDFSTEKITSHVLMDGPQGELVPGNVDGSFMLFPREPDWSEIRAILQDPFTSKEERLASARPQTPVRIDVRNGTNVTGFAGTVADKLSKVGYTVSTVGNAMFRGYEKTVIYDLTSGAKPQELARLKRLLQANVSATVPSWVAASGAATTSDHGAAGSLYAEGHTTERLSTTSTDFLIILGESTRGVVERIQE